MYVAGYKNHQICHFCSDNMLEVEMIDLFREDNID